MSKRILGICLAVVASFVAASGVLAHGRPQANTAKYQVVKACALLTLAEVKKLAPWPAHMDAFAKAEEEAVGPNGSACEYPTVRIQVMSYSPSFAEGVRKSGVPLEPVPGVGDEAFIRNNRDRYAELFAKVGPHTLTVQLSTSQYKTFAAAKGPATEIARAFAAKLR